MAPATEIATIPLTAGSKIEDPESPAGKVWQSTIDTVSSQPGYQRLYYGREVENPSVVQLFVDWDSFDAHKDFMNAPIYGPFGKHLATIMDSGFTMYHANLSPHPPSAAVTAPVTECLTFYFTSHNSTFEQNIHKFLNVCKEHAEGLRGTSAGWLLEDIPHESIGEGKKGKAYVALLGWDSVEKHMQFRDNAAFKENRHLVSEGRVGREAHHTVFVAK